MAVHKEVQKFIDQLVSLQDYESAAELKNKFDGSTKPLEQQLKEIKSWAKEKYQDRQDVQAEIDAMLGATAEGLFDTVEGLEGIKAVDEEGETFLELKKDELGRFIYGVNYNDPESPSDVSVCIVDAKEWERTGDINECEINSTNHPILRYIALGAELEYAEDAIYDLHPGIKTSECVNSLNSHINVEHSPGLEKAFLSGEMPGKTGLAAVIKELKNLWDDYKSDAEQTAQRQIDEQRSEQTGPPQLTAAKDEDNEESGKWDNWTPGDPLFYELFDPAKPEEFDEFTPGVWFCYSPTKDVVYDQQINSIISFLETLLGMHFPVDQFDVHLAEGQGSLYLPDGVASTSTAGLIKMCVPIRDDLKKIFDDAGLVPGNW